ncbi:hypothetical protein BPOR_0018g00320 [Botrytis porri]|uniref:Uncharacterized protein n=1 Tax=Botrytis porri TaxID=87229 RepID=A0A4Z1L583_9HELO|nr:hypothetical protein BPOR_0018g00320 [Botrytis porri]
MPATTRSISRRLPSSISKDVELHLPKDSSSNATLQNVNAASDKFQAPDHKKSTEKVPTKIKVLNNRSLPEETQKSICQISLLPLSLTGLVIIVIALKESSNC